ncbi:glutamyl-tRNA synthetase [Andreprevotia lacus DSM 23236]|jgi:glutamyl-tRNA synthetase|uniref:Glutamate--tRNA ligase n=1 Tax=Andreprevotia lacus DSM 23236 TaxID=1121001 RepID=A0A1W1XZ85_9NEIS|nr:glutamate--tRNA ligase [Andreprevotia lacus]SMC29226.1 glutamyl-tRNA synthetase [Andreprevotia lacus DSM 23236]
MTTVRTRFAPSPTGLLHIGGVRTALFSWAYARKHGGEFVLRIEDTDLERSTPASVAAILDGMHWVGLDYDEGPFYQMQRMERYKEVIQQLLATGHAYLCYTSREELDQMRAEAEARGEKPRYDRRWRPEPGKTLPVVPEGIKPVVRFRTPVDGVVAWDDQVKGRIEISNGELDDLIIARPDGTPTYNFCVVVDDIDMRISHVIRGDDHVNNTPRQIHIYEGIGAPVPVFAHLPMILNESGAKMSKRKDAVSVVDYDAQGFLPEALLNYLARLGWGHGDDEFFTLDQFVGWFDLKDVSPSSSRFDRDKLLWLNAQHIKAVEPQRLADRVAGFLADKGVETAAGPALAEVCTLLKDRSQTLVEMASQAEYFYRPLDPTADVVEKHLTPDDEARLGLFAEGAASLPAWDAPTLSQYIKDFVKQQGVKMPQVGMPLRAKVCGITNTPSVDAVLALLGRDEVLRRLAA